MPLASAPRAPFNPGSLPPAHEIQVSIRPDLARALPRWEDFISQRTDLPLSRHPAWLMVLNQGLNHSPYCLEVVEGGRTRGLLALAYVRSVLFGRFLVSLPYVNYGGVLAEREDVAHALIDQAVNLANRLGVRYLELRQERAVSHPALTNMRTNKTHMRLALPATVGELWDELTPKVRNQVRKGQKSGLTVTWGGHEQLSAFYEVFSHNMRDLGTPVFSRVLFHQVLHQFVERAELCVVRAASRPVAAALLLHGWGTTEVPSAGSLRQFNSSCANMLMYWHLLERAVGRQQKTFDFGRSTKDSNTFRFKKQWRAEPVPAEWQYYSPTGEVPALRTENPRFQRLIHLWQRLPVRLTRLLGPAIVRGIP